MEANIPQSYVLESDFCVISSILLMTIKSTFMNKQTFFVKKKVVKMQKPKNYAVQKKNGLESFQFFGFLEC